MSLCLISFEGVGDLGGITPRGTRRQHRQREHEVEVVVGGDAVEALEAAAETAMYDDMLAIGPLERPNRGHQRAARAGAVAGAPRVHMLRVQAERAVIAVPPATGHRPDEALAVAALEALV